MANNFTIPGVWVVDTASSQVINDDKRVRINTIRWVIDGDADDGDDLKITDADDNLIYHDIAHYEDGVKNNYVSHMHFTSPLELQSTGGIKVSTLTHGTVYIYYVT
jgi:hypothetical protein